MPEAAPTPEECKAHVAFRLDSGYERNIRAYAVRRGLNFSAAMQLIVYEGMVVMGIVKAEK
jgi:hypothetical protein